MTTTLNIPPAVLPTLTEAQYLRLRRYLDLTEADYDPAERMLAATFFATGKSYHTTLSSGIPHRVHRTRETLNYAVALFDAGDPAERERALGILDRMLSLQDTDPASRTYGIWSWFLEEPLSKMAPPDWNWADFCGAQLLEIAHTHGPGLPEEMQARVRAAILHAARSIERRNVAPDYTNIAIMGSYVTLAASELYGQDDLHAYGLAKFRRFYEYTLEQGGFSEYNSPTYTHTALDELGRIQRYVRDPEVTPLVRTLYRRTWEDIARHFHAPTRQWAGPHSRAYHSLLGSRIHGLIHRATEGRFSCPETEAEVDSESLQEHRHNHVCPSDLEAAFFSLETPSEFRQTFSKGTPDMVGTTFLSPAFTLGTINEGDLWNQRRALIAYWGTAQAPKYLHLRFLHDGWDFSAARIACVQRGGEALCTVAFASDGGDTHVNLDMIQNGTIQADDLRLRIEFGNLPLGVRPMGPIENETDWPWTLDLGEVSIGLSLPHAFWDGAPGRWESGGDGEHRQWIDLVFHHGPARSFRLPELKTTSIALALRIVPGSSPVPMPPVRVEAESELPHAAWEGLVLPVVPRPDTTARIRAVHAET